MFNYQTTESSCFNRSIFSPKSSRKSIKNEHKPEEEALTCLYIGVWSVESEAKICDKNGDFRWRLNEDAKQKKKSQCPETKLESPPSLTNQSPKIASPHTAERTREWMMKVGEARIGGTYEPPYEID